MYGKLYLSAHPKSVPQPRRNPRLVSPIFRGIFGTPTSTAGRALLRPAFSASFTANKWTASSTRLDLAESLDFDEWCALGAELARVERGHQWWIGDWWTFGGHRYGERAKAAAEGLFGRSFQGLMDCGFVARKFETSRRRELVSFKHHREVASLPPPEADELLDQAEAESWSTRQLRAEVKVAADEQPSDVRTAFTKHQRHRRDMSKSAKAMKRPPAGLATMIEAERALVDAIEAGRVNGEVERAGGDRKSINVRTADIDRVTYSEIGVSRQRVAEWRRLRDADWGVIAILDALWEDRAPTEPIWRHHDGRIVDGRNPGGHAARPASNARPTPSSATMRIYSPSSSA
jgi:hypothetical protein